MILIQTSQLVSSVKLIETMLRLIPKTYRVPLVFCLLDFENHVFDIVSCIPLSVYVLFCKLCVHEQ